MSDQELKELKLRTEIEEGIHQSVQTLLEAVKINPNMYLSPRLLYLRNFVSFVNRNDETFSVCSGDDTVRFFCRIKNIEFNFKNHMPFKKRDFSPAKVPVKCFIETQ